MSEKNNAKNAEKSNFTNAESNSANAKKNTTAKKTKNHKTPWTRHRLTFGQWAADKLTGTMGSWGFIIIFFTFLGVWIYLNIELVIVNKWDPYPFILLNLTLSCLAAIQAPIILMSQNRSGERDRRRIAKDYYIDKKAEKEIMVLQIQLLELRELISKQSLESQTKKIADEIKSIQNELENVGKTLQIE